MSIRRGFACIDSGQLHYRYAGSGPPVILLHPSPQSSAFSMPMALRLAKNFTAIAVDTPGYGLSDPLPGNPLQPRLEDYVAPLRQFLDALGIDKAAIYGNATGAEIAQLFAFAHPERVAVCMLDTAGHKEDADLDAMLADYFPDVTPRRDGGHLLVHWDMVRSLSLFSPWQKTTREHRLAIDMPSPGAIQNKLLDYLSAGAAYAAAYRPAFYTAKHQLISRVSVPATLTRWQGKPDLSEVDALIARRLPENFTVLRPGPSMDERLAASEEYLLDHYLPSVRQGPSMPPQCRLARHDFQKMRIDVAGGQLQARLKYHRGMLQGGDFSWLALHDAGASSRQMTALLDAIATTRPGIAIDYPNCGDSDHCLPTDKLSIDALASCIALALETLGIRRVAIIGQGVGGMVAMALAEKCPELVQSITQLDVMCLEAAEKADWLAHYTPSLAPQWDGSHLTTAWAIVRDMALFSPWYRRTRAGVIPGNANLDPTALDTKVQDLLKAGDAWPTLIAEALKYPFEAKLRAVRTPCVLAAVAGTSQEVRSRRALALATQCQMALLAEDPDSWAATISSVAHRAPGAIPASLPNSR